MRKLLAITASIALLTSLAACSGPVVGQPVAAQNCKSLGGGGDVESIDVSTDLTKEPTVKFPTPLNPTKPQSAASVKGKGAEITGSQLVTVEYSGYNATTGEKFDGTAFDGSNATSLYLSPKVNTQFCNALAGMHEGSRVVFAFPAKDAHGNQGLPDWKIGADDSLVFVFDIKKVTLVRATGAAVAPVAGMPSVVLDTLGAPGVTIQSGAEAPSELKVSTLIQGEGQTLKDGDSITVNYAGFTWANTIKFESSWDNGEPANFSLQEGALIAGMRTALIGKKVGSQILMVIPPSLGYGDTAQGLIPANSTLVFVVDILAAEN